MNENESIQDIKNLLSDLAKSQKNSSEKFDRELKEYNEQWKKEQEAYKIRQKEIDKKIKEAYNLFTTQWGRLIESLVEGELVYLFKNKGFAVESVSTNRKGIHNGEDYEFDIIVHNGNDVVLVEVKTTLRVKDVDKHIYRLNKSKAWLKEYKNHDIYGAVAYLKAHEESDKYAERNGLWVIRATGNSASIINQSNFKPSIF